MNPESLLRSPLPTAKLTAGCPVLDRVLGVVVPCSSVTEIFSESGCGKTQLCLQLLLSVQLPSSLGSLSASSLYLHSEAPINSADHLFDVLLKTDFALANPKTQFPIKLIVIDSIAALFRSEFDNNPSDLKRRSDLFFRISGNLKALAYGFGLEVVVTNQVVEFVGTGEGLNGVRIGNLGCLYSFGRRVCPALRISWANCVNSRLFLSRSEEIVGKENGLVDVGGDDFVQRRTKRQLHVVFAPHFLESSCEFVIVREEVFAVEK
ncbi:homolog of X-ray repair cross complementing 3 [Actinidia rufa]|uniref:Homolog of X-ray repair cross complementing 3 n=1 Tax=Actinidia rufa TaxID=165716 RepID=A0A7J0DIR2_9ERIC|nr:homolog of X-ray repair cross complementing 3 [Actinidia rufa]